MKKNFRNTGSGFGSRNFNKDREFNQEGNRSYPREMHKVTCADCKKECEVPFKPIEGRPVYCKECYPKHKPQRF